MKRFDYLDVLKGIAIMAVVLYHIGYMQYGFLGVDVFLVVNGFLLAKAFRGLSTCRGGVKFIVKRVLRLYPLTLLATGVCLLWGSYWMLPYTYQDLAQNAIATNLFANNILMSIKSADYWNVLNDYKPLMHTWYLGIIVQFYVVFALIVIVAKKIIRSKKDITPYIVGVCLMGSLVLYLLPCFNTTQKFYFLPFRLFEFCAGCLTAFWVNNRKSSNKPMDYWAVCAYALMLCLLFINAEYLSATFRLLSTVALTCVLLVSLPHVSQHVDRIASNRWLAAIGKASFSIYIWHQIVFAFCRYSFTVEFDMKVFALTILITGLLSYISYKFVEQGMASYLKKVHGERNALIGCVGSALVLTGVAFWLNSCSGVIRDVPELDTYVGKTTERMHIAYNEEGYNYDKDFVSSDKVNIVVVGDSYGRDFVNILREMKIEDRVEIAYVKNHEKTKANNIKRIQNSDFAFFTLTIVPQESHVDAIYQFADGIGIRRDKMMIVGSKRFGHSLGQVYAKRHQKDYFNSTSEIDEWYLTQNEEFKVKCQGRYIDMITPVLVSGNHVRVFNDDHKIISQDCEHLTQNGAKYYAKLLENTISALLDSVSKNGE